MRALISTLALILASHIAHASSLTCRDVFAKDAATVYLEVPLTPQIEDYTCGTACLRAVLKFAGELEISEPDLAKLMATSPRHGSTPSQITSAAQKLGFFVNAGENLSIEDVENSLRAGRPVISLIQSETPGYGHWVVVIGMSADQLKLMDPGDPAQAGNFRFIAKEKFVRDWWHIYSGKKVHRGVGIQILAAGR